MSVKAHANVVECFKGIPFYKKPIEKPKIKRLRNIDLLSELPFCEQFSVVKTSHAFRGDEISYKVEIIERKDSNNQLEATKSIIKDFFSGLLNETKGFKYQITLKFCEKNTEPMEQLNLDQFFF